MISEQEAYLKCKLLDQKAMCLVVFLKMFHVTHETSAFLVLMAA